VRSKNTSRLPGKKKKKRLAKDIFWGNKMKKKSIRFSEERRGDTIAVEKKGSVRSRRSGSRTGKRHFAQEIGRTYL